MNVHNFMDGLDGLASLQTLCFLLPAALLFQHAGRSDLTLLALIVVGSVIAFLRWNLPPARLYLGDAGAVFLGFFIALLMLVGWQSSWVIFISLLILYCVFFVDATCTIVWRLFRRENCFTAHRSHLFQQLARRHGTPWVLKGILLLNLGWLLPLAALVTSAHISPLVGLLFACAPLTAGYVRWHQTEVAIPD
jgi:Fuc2NAc and GlcNAc transferase